MQTDPEKDNIYIYVIKHKSLIRCSFHIHDVNTGFCNTMAATGRAGTAYAFGAPQIIPVFRRVSDAQSLVFCTALCQRLFVCLSFVDLRFLITP